jgi:hypothetical protein
MNHLPRSVDARAQVRITDHTVLDEVDRAAEQNRKRVLKGQELAEARRACSGS